MSSPEKLSPLSVGMAWASRITTIGLEFALPSLLGFYVDRYLGSRPWGVAIGSLFGFGAGMYHLLRLTQELNAKPKSSGGSNLDPSD